MELRNTYQTTARHSERDEKPVMVFVDDRPTTLSNRVVERTDVDWILLRHKDHALPSWHLERTEKFKAYYRDRTLPEEEQIRGFAHWCAQNGLRPQHLLNPSEPEQRFAHKLGRFIGIPALSEEQVNWLRNKVMMKYKFRETGFRTADYAAVETTSDIISFGRTHGWPVVIKPQEGFACIDTYLLSDENDAREHPIDKNASWMVETFVQGQEWECCALIQNGQVLDTYLSYMPARPLDIVDGAINANITVCPVHEDFPVDTRKMVQGIVDGMSLDHGYMHMEFFVDGRTNPVIGETALRLAGCEIPANHGLANGFNLFDALIDIHLGKKVDLRYSEKKCVGDLLLPAKPGRIVNMTSPHELLRMPGVLEYKPRLKMGDFADPKRASHTCSAVVHVEGANVDEVLQRMNFVLKQYNFETVREMPFADPRLG